MIFVLHVILTENKAMIMLPQSEIAYRIREYIVRHGLKPGDQLPTQDELIRHLNVGHRRLREGLSVLKHQGIIETHSKGGTIVCQPAIKTLGEPITWHLDITGYRFEDLVSARAWLESGTAAEAAEKRAARDLLKILDALEQLEAVADAERDDTPEDEAFHLAIIQATHNTVLATFGQLIRLQFKNKVPEPDSPEYRKIVNRQHRSIYEAIQRQDRMAARDLMYAHVIGQLVYHQPTEND